MVTPITRFVDSLDRFPDRTIAAPDAAADADPSINTGIFTIRHSGDGDVYHYWSDNAADLESFHRDRLAPGYDEFFWTPFSGCPDDWTSFDDDEYEQHPSEQWAARRSDETFVSRRAGTANLYGGNCPTICQLEDFLSRF
jgi:hypothetical protein